MLSLLAVWAIGALAFTLLAVAGIYVFVLVVSRYGMRDNVDEKDRRAALQYLETKLYLIVILACGVSLNMALLVSNVA